MPEIVVKTPTTIITGFLGSGKTTLLRHLLKHSHKKLAIIMNEFGKVAIDSKIIKGKNVNIAELSGGCVCCSLAGEFEAAVREVIEKYQPEQIIVETTGVAEPDALAVDVQSMDLTRLDAIVTIVDADSMLRFPSIGHTSRKQIEMADLILLNKTDLIDMNDRPKLEKKIKEINKEAEIIPAVNCKTDPALVLGLEVSGRKVTKEKLHALEDYDYFAYKGSKKMNLDKTIEFINSVDALRAKGFINTGKETHLISCVNGRCTMENWPYKEKTQLVFIGKKLDKKLLEQQLKKCEV